MADKGHTLCFAIPGPPVGLQHEGGARENKNDPTIQFVGLPIKKKKTKRYTEEKSRKYMNLCATYAMKAIADDRAQGQWPYEGDVSMQFEIYYIRESPRPDPENVAAILQDGFTKILWMNDRNVLPYAKSHWWPGKNRTPPPPAVFDGARAHNKYLGGVCVRIEKIDV